MVVVDDESVAKMSGGDVDVEQFLVRRNTLGNDEPQLNFSKPKSNGGCGKRWWFASAYAEGGMVKWVILWRT